MSASARPGSAGRWRAVKQLPGRVPLHTKLISALLGLVVIALVVISVASLAQFRNYLQDRADAQLTQLMRQALKENPTVGGPQGPTFSFSGYVVELKDTQGARWCRGATGVPGRTSTVPGPAVPSAQSWLSANAGKTVTVMGFTSGQDHLGASSSARLGYNAVTEFGQIGRTRPESW